MVEQYLVWALLVGIGVGAGAMWFALGRLPRRTDDVAPEELAAEAEQISRTIAERGGVAPAALVEEILELHLEYMADEPIELEPITNPGGDAPPAPASRPAGEPPGR